MSVKRMSTILISLRLAYSSTSCGFMAVVLSVCKLLRFGKEWG